MLLRELSLSIQFAVGLNMESDLWPRLEAQFALHHPVLLGALRPGATLSAIEEAEHCMGFAMPEELRRAYLRHDGCAWLPLASTNLVAMYRWISLDEMTRHWVQHKRMYEEWLPEADIYPDPTDEDEVLLSSVRPGWIPIGEMGSQTMLFIDLEPGPAGCAGQLIGFSIVEGQGVVIARNLEDYLRQLVEGFEAGQVSYDRVNHYWVNTATREFFKPRRDTA